VDGDADEQGGEHGKEHHAALVQEGLVLVGVPEHHEDPEQ
jgi:hypothetical protein